MHVFVRSGGPRPLPDNSLVLAPAYYIIMAIGVSVYRKEEADAHVSLLQRACADFCYVAELHAECSVRGFVRPSRNASPGLLSVVVFVPNVWLTSVKRLCQFQVCLVSGGNNSCLSTPSWPPSRPWGSECELSMVRRLEISGFSWLGSVLYEAGTAQCVTISNQQLRPQHCLQSEQGGLVLCGWCRGAS